MKCFTIAATAAFGSADAQTEKNWSYKTNDDSVYGPSDWGEHTAACDGKRQSPIDIVPKTNCKAAGSKKSKSPLKFSGECGQHKVKQLYDAFKIEAQNGTCQVAANGKPYNYLQSHFHAPSEHTLNGKVYDAEIHYVHQAVDKSGLLVVGLFFQKKADATTDPFVLKFLQEIKNTSTNKTVDATFPSFFPTLDSTIAAGRLFNYPGSLTNPTCDETVDWWVVEKPLVISASDFDAIESDLKRIEASDDGKAARPVQPLNGRVITTY